MRCDLRMKALLLLLLAAAACSDDDAEELGKAPHEFVREAPNLGVPIPDASTDASPEIGRFAFDGGDGVPCCDKKFSFPATLDGETAVRVRGDGLDASGLALTKKKGVWTGALCLPPELSGSYYYELSFPAEESDGSVADDQSGGAFIDERYNPDEPTTTSVLLGTVNAFVPKNSDCK